MNIKADTFVVGKLPPNTVLEVTREPKQETKVLENSLEQSNQTDQKTEASSQNNESGGWA